MAKKGRNSSVGRSQSKFPSIRRSGIRKGSGRRISAPQLPELVVVERFGIDEDGVPLARPVSWPGPGPAPTLRLVETGLTEAFPMGARASARLVARETGETEARIIRTLSPASARIVGVYRRGFREGAVTPADRRNRAEYRVGERDANGAEDDELVIAEQLSTGRIGSPRVRIIERLGQSSDAGAISLLAIASYDIPTEFPIAAIAEAEAARPAPLAGRTDLRDIPLVTIDGADARDFDDAVWAEPDADPENRGGWHLVVAIADVCWYVRPGIALDQEARRRGNSVYFPDRVVPMLPEALSNELCSLKPGVERACLAIHLWLDAAGEIVRHQTIRGLMRSAARLTYEEVQAAIDGPPGPLRDQILAPLYGAYRALDQARRRRGTLELDLPERRVVLDAGGAVAR